MSAFSLVERFMDVAGAEVKTLVSTPSKRGRFVSSDSHSHSDIESDLSDEDPPSAGTQQCSAGGKCETPDSSAPEVQPPARSSQRARDSAAMQCCQVCGDTAAGARAFTVGLRIL